MIECEKERYKEITREIPLGPLLHQMDRLMYRNLNSRARAEGLDEATMMHGWVMRYLYMNSGKVICQKDIEHTFSIRRSTVTSIIQLMERNGYIERRPVPGDARLKQVLLTSKGEESHLRIEHIIDILEKEQIKGITEKEMDSFYLVMNKIKKNLIRVQAAGEEDEYASNNIEGSEGI